MDFFHSQDVARRKTSLLVAYFVLAVVMMIIALYVAVLLALSATGDLTLTWADGHSPGGQLGPPWWRPDVLGIVAVATLGIVAAGSLYKTAELRQGGEAVAHMLGGRRINPNTDDLSERRLLNVVEEMALAAGMAVPAVFLLDRETSINAFAAGFTPTDAVIGVNRGTIDHLNRDELQGVIAHEFSHILNGDMRLNIRLIGILHGILVLALIGYYALRIAGQTGHSRGRREKGGGGVAVILIIGLAAMVIGYVGLFFGRLIKASVSRQREYLADASAVQFTRQPAGLAGALKKIGGLVLGSRMETLQAEVASHMFFGSAAKRLPFSPLATHPPLEDRIRRLEPEFDGRFPKLQAADADQAGRQQPSQRQAAAGRGPVVGTPGLRGRIPLDPISVLAAIGATSERQVAYAGRLIGNLPPPLREALREPFAARAVVYAMLLDDREGIRTQQLQTLQAADGEPTARETLRLAAPVRDQGPESRLPILEIVLGTLRGLSPAQYKQFRASVQQLVEADRETTLWEFVLLRVLFGHLDRHFRAQPPTAVRYHAMAGILPDAAALLSALVHAGQNIGPQAQLAFDQATAALQAGQTQPRLLPSDQCTLDVLSEALEKLSQTSPAIKKRLLTAAVLAVAADGTATVAEAELLRAIASALDCPIPPILAGPLAPQTDAPPAP